ncbi:MAG: prepilin-type N-terminal cleavage/methylation domain-containing protein [Alphaproteobacteria bacterium]|nr:prepilin-type N-terminal cleavage/methylation domain-containing protein [Alphaproteobacteria bacterium]
MSRGFSLLELSISIVVIALIFGGILVGREMIQNSIVIKNAQQMIEIKRAANEFMTIYNAVPGDFSAATRVWGSTWPDGVTDGDGDGLLGFPNSAGVLEHHEFWRQLAKANLIRGNYCGHLCHSNGNALPWHPPTAITNGAYNAVRGGYYGIPDTNQLRVARLLSAAPWWDGAFTPRDAKMADVKFDDGIPSSGFITGVAAQSQPWSNCTTTNPTAGPSVGEYAINVQEVSCMVVMNLDEGQQP